MPLPISDQTNTTHFAQGISVMNRHAMSYWRFAVLLAVVAVVAFAPISAPATITVTVESPPTLTVRMDPPGSEDGALGEILEGDGPVTVWFELRDFDQVEDEGTGMLTTSDADVSFRVITQDGSAAFGADYEGIDIEVTIPEGAFHVSLDIAISDDGDGEGPETFEVMITEVTSGNATVHTTDYSGTVTILDDDGEPPPAELPVLVMRQDFGWPSGNIEVIEGGDPVTVWFELRDFDQVEDEGTGMLTTSDADVSFRVITQDGSAAFGADYEGIDIEVTIPEGAFHVSLDIAISDDGDGEGPETFEVMITEVTSGNATVHTTDYSGTVTILDDDGEPPPAELPVLVMRQDFGWPSGNIEVIEGGDPVTVWFDLLDGEGNSTTSADAVRFRVVTDPIPSLPGPLYFEGIDREVTLPMGDSSVSLDIAIYDDDQEVGGAIFEVQIAALISQDNATLSVESNSVSVTILDNDAPPAELPEISARGSNTGNQYLEVLEGGGLVTVWFDLLDGSGNSTTSAGEVRFRVKTVDNGATAGGNILGFDYEGIIDYEVTIPAGSSAGGPVIVIYDDGVMEGEESFEVMITEVLSGNATAGSSAYVEILDDDGPSIEADAYEPNDVWQDAKLLVTDGLDVALTFHYEGDYDPDTDEETAGDQDWFSFDAIEGEVYTMTTSNLLQIETSDGDEVIWTDTDLWLYRLGVGDEGNPVPLPDERDPVPFYPGLVYIAENDDWDTQPDGNDGYASQIIFQAPATATYYVVVDDLNGQLGACNFNIAGAFVPPPSTVSADAYEPNDIPENATSLSTNSSLPDGDGTFHVAGDSPVDWPTETGTGDHDWYSFEATQGNNYRIAAFDGWTDPVTDPALQVFDSVFVMLHWNDNYIEEDPGYHNDLEAVIHFEAVSSGTHYILVTERNASSGAYNLDIHESSGEVTVDPSYAEIGGHSVVSISTTDTTGLNIDSIDLHLNYDPTVLQPVFEDAFGPIGAAEFLPLVPADWSKDQNVPEDGTMIVAMAHDSANPLMGGGGLVRLTFNVLAAEDTVGQTTHVELTRAQMPDGVDFRENSNHDVHLVQFEYGDVSGKNGVTGHDASLVLDATLESMLGGLFHFPIETDAPEWCPIPILPFDAERVGNVDGSEAYEISFPTPEGPGDLTGLFTGIDSMDASLILQHVVRLIDEFPTGPPNNGVPPIVAAPGLLSSSAVLDLSGPSSSLRPGETFTISLDTAGVSDLYAGEIGLQYDASLVRPVEVFTAGSGSGRVTPQWVHRVKDGTLAAAFASATPVDTGASLVQVRFETLVDSSHPSVIRSSHVRLNRDLVKRQLTYAYQIEPYRFQLLANYPNPFNPETWIPFELAEEADVTIRIYGLDGQHIRTLDLGRYGQGSYTDRDQAAHWDGRNEYGEQVASSMYIYELRAGTYRAMRRMVIRK